MFDNSSRQFHQTRIVSVLFHFDPSFTDLKRDTHFGSRIGAVEKSG